MSDLVGNHIVGFPHEAAHFCIRIRRSHYIATSMNASTNLAEYSHKPILALNAFVSPESKEQNRTK